MDNDKGLYLPLKINLDEWEKSLAQADSDLQKAMKQMRAEVSDVRLKYDVEIAGAKSMGDNSRALELENKKLNIIYEAQRKAVEALNKAYRNSIREKGANATESKILATQLLKESRALERTKAQMDVGGFMLGQRLSNGLAGISPEFARVRSMVSGVTSALAGAGGAAATFSTALGGIGLALAAVAAAAGGLDALSNGFKKTAKEGRDASDPIYQLRENLQSTYEDAAYLWGVATVDGTDAFQLTNALVKLDAVLEKDKQNTSEAAVALARYGAELKNADGKLKPYKEQLQELSRAARTAAEAGEFADFKAVLPKAFASTTFDHLLLGLDDYAKKAETGVKISDELYRELHKLSDAEGALAVAQSEYNRVKGELAAKTALNAIDAERIATIAQTEVLNDNKERYAAVNEEVKELITSWEKLKGIVAIAWEDMKTDIAGGFGNALAKAKELSKYAEYIPVRFASKKIFGDFLGLDKYFENAKQKMTAAYDTVEKRLKKNEEKPNSKTNEINEQKAKRNEKFEKELLRIQQTAYQREIQAIEDKKAAYIAAGVAEVDADRLFQLQKAEIDKKYYEKDKAERDKQRKEQEDAYRQQIENAKKAREASISEAESTLKSNIKLIRYIQRQKDAGTYSEEDARAYANRLYMRQSGIRSSDVSALKELGVSTLKDIANARDRIFGQFANATIPKQEMTNNFTFNFDGTVVNDVSAMDMLANKVAAIIQPSIEKAVNGKSGGNAYGY